MQSVPTDPAPTKKPPRTPYRSVWWVDLLVSGTIIATVAFVFRAAGGTTTDLNRAPVDWIEHPSEPVVVAFLTCLAMLAVVQLTGYQARRSERSIAAWDAYRARRTAITHPAIAAWDPNPSGPQPGRGVVPLPRRAGSGSGEPGESRARLEQVVRLCGPITFKQIHEKLTAGGPWGAPVPISEAAMARLLREPGPGNKPVSWLAPRVPGGLFDHVDNVRMRTEPGA